MPAAGGHPTYPKHKRSSRNNVSRHYRNEVSTSLFASPTGWYGRSQIPAHPC